MSYTIYSWLITYSLSSNSRVKLNNSGENQTTRGERCLHIITQKGFSTTFLFSVSWKMSWFSSIYNLYRHDFQDIYIYRWFEPKNSSFWQSILDFTWKCAIQEHNSWSWTTNIQVQDHESWSWTQNIQVQDQ